MSLDGADLARYNPSFFLAFRRFWPLQPSKKIDVASEGELLERLAEIVGAPLGKAGILLSGGMDSAILARLMPAGSIAYTIVPEGEDGEFFAAKKFVRSDMEHRRVVVSKRDFFDAAKTLIQLKGLPVVPHEPAFYLAAQQARADGVQYLVSGQGADGGYAGLPSYYRHTRCEDFRRYIRTRYLDPERFLRSAMSVDPIVEQYKVGTDVDVQRFLAEVGSEGNAVETTISLTGMEAVLPYTRLRWAQAFDVKRILSGEPKYMIAAAYKCLYPETPINEKFAFSLPYETWLASYWPARPEFRYTSHLFRISGKRAFLLYSLERYLDWVEPDGKPTTGRRIMSALLGQLRLVLKMRALLKQRWAQAKRS